MCCHHASKCLLRRHALHVLTRKEPFHLDITGKVMQSGASRLFGKMKRLKRHKEE